MSDQDSALYDLFVSYARADREWVEGYLLDALKQAGTRCFSEEAFTLGVPRLTEFERAIQQSRRTLLILSPAYLADTLSQFVDLLAQSYGLETSTWPVIPLILEPVVLSPRLAALVALDATDPDERPQAIAKLCTALQVPVPAPPLQPACPYPGMVPFAEADAGRFFGRDREIEDILERLRLHPFLTVIGSSGSGKSSLVFAGLIPALRRSQRFPSVAGQSGAPYWTVKAMRPGATPLANLQGTIGDLVNLETGQPIGPRPFRLLLVIDQLEELFTLNAKDAEPFQDAILHLSKVPGIYVVLTARADFYPSLMASHLWPEIQAHRAEVLPLDADGLRQAIVRPAERAGVYVEGALVERLVADATGEPGVLPFVQETLNLLWEKLERRFLPLRAYDALVLPLSAYGTAPRTGLQVAMARRADATLADLSPAQQAIARRIFLRLIQFGEGRPDTRRQQPVTALRSTDDKPGDFERALQHLASGRLLTLTGKSDEPDSRADIAHEALIAGWPTLQNWLSERRGAEQKRRRLGDQVAEWQRLGEKSGGLLDRVELGEAERWLASPDATDLGYNAALPALVRASRRALRKTFWLRAGPLALAVIAIIAVAGIYLRQEATRHQLDSQRLVASGRQVAALARSRLDNDQSQLALLLGIAATKVLTETVEADIVLVDALDAWRGEAVLSGHSARVYRVVFSPNGQYLASISNDRTARVWQISGERRALVLRGHTRDLTDVAFSRNSQWLVTASRDGTARIWDVVNGQTLHVLNHGGDIVSLKISPDGKTVATGGEDGAVWLWDLATGQPAPAGPFRAESEGNVAAVEDIAFSPDGTLLLAGSTDTTIWLWQISSRQHVRLTGFKAGVSGVAFSPDGRYVAGIGGDTVLLWNREDGLKSIQLKWNQHSGLINGIAFSPDSRYLATGANDSIALIWDLHRPELVPKLLLGHTGPIWSIAFSPDSQLLATTSWDRTARLWSVDEGRLQATLAGHEAELWIPAFSPDGSLLATPDETGVVRLWRTQTGGDLAGHAVSSKPVTAMTLVGGKVAAVGEDGILELWRPELDATQAYTVGNTRLTAVASGPDATLLATGSADGRINVLDAATGASISTWSAHNGEVRGLLFLPDGVHLASAGADRIIRLWDLRGQLIRELRGHTNEVTALIAGRDPATLFSAGADGTIRRWDWQTGREQATIEANGPLLALALSPDGRRLAAGGRGPTAGIWDISAGAPMPAKALLVLPQDATVRALTFSPDGSRLMIGNEAGLLRSWKIPADLDAGTMASTMGEATAWKTHRGYWVVGLAFNRDGKQIFTASSDGTLHAWPVGTADLLALACRRAGIELTADEWRMYLPSVATQVALCPGQTAAPWTVADQLDPPRAAPAAVAVAADARPVIRYFEAVPGSTIGLGEPVLLRWDVSGAIEAYLEYGGERHGVTAPHEQSFAPTADTVYRLIAVNAAGERSLALPVTVKR